MVDIDHFKNVNDIHGHKVGDITIQHIAQILAKQLRNNDLVGRWGGEEFVILLPTTDIDVAFDVAERARAAIESTKVKIDNLNVKITASFGVTSHFNPSSLNSIVEQADKALYEAKNAGRNLVCKNAGSISTLKPKSLLVV